MGLVVQSKFEQKLSNFPIKIQEFNTITKQTISDLSLFSPCRKVESWRVLVLHPSKPISACLELRKLQQFRVYGGKAIEGDILKGNKGR